MRLDELLLPWMHLSSTKDIHAVHHDSRKISTGDVFLAYPGVAADGRSYIQEALTRGALAVIYEPNQLSSDQKKQIDPKYCYALPELAQRVASIYARFYGYPSRSLKTIGVTGTNGKTTVAYLLAQAYQALGHPSAYIGTLGIGPIEQLNITNNTTPDALTLHSFFRQCVDQEIQWIAMEVSSHGLDQHRVDGIEFQQAIFTNLTQDHLDYHHTMAAYANAKAQLFGWDTLQQVVVNRDDAYAVEMLKRTHSSVQQIRYSTLYEDSELYAFDVVSSMQGLSFKIKGLWGDAWIESSLMGAFNLYNLLAVIGSLCAAGYALTQIGEVIKQLKPAPGRLEVVHTQPCVIVDYAHTPDALSKALSTLKPLTKGQLWVVFGCGGDRDKTKRPIMGRIAMELADKVIVTSDNPRTEDPKQIISDIILEIRPYHVEEDRQKAIEYALAFAQAEDMILIAGKGHECYQYIGQERLFFSDQAVVRHFF